MVGYAVQSGVVLQKCGNYWCRFGTSTIITSSLANSSATNVVSIVEAYEYSNCLLIINQTHGEKKIAGNCLISGTKKIYDKCEGGSRKWNDGVNYCSSKGMHMITLPESSYSTSGGVPSCGGETWTSTKKGGTDWYIVSSGRLSAWSKDGVKNIRCVK